MNGISVCLNSCAYCYAGNSFSWKNPLFLFTWNSCTSGKWSSEASSLVLDHCWLRWFTHNDQLLVRLHYNTRKLWEPNAHMNKALEYHTNLVYVSLRGRNTNNQQWTSITYIPFKNAASWEIGNFKCISYIVWFVWIGPNWTGSICIWMHSSVIGKQWWTLESNWFLQSSCYHVCGARTGCCKRTLNFAYFIRKKWKCFKNYVLWCFSCE